MWDHQALTENDVVQLAAETRLPTRRARAALQADGAAAYAALSLIRLSDPRLFKPQRSPDTYLAALRGLKFLAGDATQLS